jgi:molybdopterin-containing oxidoreductase family membrane subunit
MFEGITKKRLVKDNVVHLLAKISGWMITTYIVAKIIDTIYWATVTAPSQGFKLMDFYSDNAFYGIWILIVEIVVCGIVPAVILIKKSYRENSRLLLTAIVLGTLGVCLNRWVMVLQIMAVPVMSFDTWALYYPSWQEVATTVLPVAYGVILISLAYRYLPVFPQEKELNAD